MTLEDLTHTVVPLLIERVNSLENIIKSKDGLEKKLKTKIEELENVIDVNKREFELLKAEINPKIVKFESEFKTMSWLASDVVRPIITNKSTVPNVSIDSLISSEIERMMYQIDPQQSDPILPCAYNSVDFLEHCGQRPTEISETDNNVDLITPTCGRKESTIATDRNMKCDSYRAKLLEGINEKADSVATNLAKA
ncbi:unnamed protein product [Mytilus coruscus]|uniref:Uncharacterized protein n=1 Tax=Mytilus coruscus TaxID=42192 RepID=A0A6J8DHX3_MYTCO|nr:unnamed protein product [Mytilus coruscus]